MLYVCDVELLGDYYGAPRGNPYGPKGYSVTGIWDILWTAQGIFPRKVLRAQGCENVMGICEKAEVSVSL